MIQAADSLKEEEEERESVWGILRGGGHGQSCPFLVFAGDQVGLGRKRGLTPLPRF